MKTFPKYRPDTITRTNLLRHLTIAPRSTEQLVEDICGRGETPKKLTKLVRRAESLLSAMVNRDEVSIAKDGWASAA